MSGEVKVYNGSVFNWKPVKVWNGTAWVTKPLKYWNGTAWVTTNAGGGVGTNRSAPILGYPTPQTSNPTTIPITLGPDWVGNSSGTADQLKLEYANNLAFTSSVVLTHGLTDTDAASGTVNMSLSGITFTGVVYFRAYEATSTNLSNVVSRGDTTGPTITTSGTQSVIETQPLSISLTATDAGAGVPALLSDGTSPGWYISGGVDQLQYEIAIVSGAAKARWYNNGTQTTSSPQDQGFNNVYDLQVTAVDYSGNKSSPLAIAATVTVADLDPNHQTFATISGAARSSAIPAAETWTISGLDAIPVPISVSGLKYRKSTDSGATWSAWGTASGTVVNGNQIQVEVDPSSGSYETATTGSITVGSYTTSFTVQTLADPANIPWTPGTAMAGTGSGNNVNYSNINFTQTGLAIFVVKQTNTVTSTGLTVGGVAATPIEHNGTAVDLAMYAAPITSTGSKAIQVQTGSFPTGGTLLWGMLVPTSNTPTSSAHKGQTFSADPHSLGTTLTVPASGILIAGTLSGSPFPSSLTWASPMNGSMYDSASGLGIGISRTTCNPTFSDGQTFHSFVAATWG